MTEPQAEPLIDIREHETFQADQAAVAEAREHADRLASEEPFRDREEAGQAAEAVKTLREVRKRAEAHKLEITEPHRLTTNAVNAGYTELLSPAKAAEEALKRKGLAFRKAEEARAEEKRRQETERRQREQEAKIQEAQEMAQLAAEEPEDKEAQELAAKAREDAAAAAMNTAPAAPIAHPKSVR